MKATAVPSKGSSKRAPEKKAAPAAPPINIQNFVDKKLALNQTIEVAAPNAFPNEENDANNWSISVMVKYLKEKMELPEYVDKFKRCEIDGAKFVAMDESNLSAIEVSNHFHALKIASHAQILREQVLEKAMVEKPTSVLDWGPNHVAAWLFYDKSCPETAVHALRSKITGHKMKTFTGKDALTFIKATELSESDSATKALDELAKNAQAAERKETQAGALATSDEKTAPPNEAVGATKDIDPLKDGATVGKAKSSKTAMKKNREKLKAAELRNKQDAALDPGEEHDEHHNDSLPPQQSNKRKKVVSDTSDGEVAHKAAYSAAMSAIFSGVQHVAGTGATAPPTIGTTSAQLAPIVEHPDSDVEDSRLDTVGPTKKAKTSKKTKKAKASAALAGSSTCSEPESELSIVPRDEHQPEAALAAVTVAPQDIYSKSAERKKFLSKIKNLRNVVAEHASAMSELREHAQHLRSENLSIKEQQKQMLLQGTQSKELISSLVEDRNMALAELERITALYGQHASQERNEAVKDLQLLARDTHKARQETQVIWKSQTQQLSELGSMNVASAYVTGVAQHTHQPASEGVRKHRKHRRRTSVDSDSSGSDLDDEPSGLSVTTKKVPVPPASHLAVAAVVPVQKVSSGQVPATPCAPPVAAAKEALPLSAPLPVAPSSASVTSTAPISGTSAVGNAVVNAAVNTVQAAPAVDLMRMVEKSADSVHTLWINILRTYRMPRMYATDHLSDSKLLLRHISLHWQRLGHRLLQDAHAPETDKDVRKALKGLEKCAKLSVLGATRAAKRSLESSTDSPLNKSLIASSSFGKLGGSTTGTGILTPSGKYRSKKGNRDLGSTAFPDGGQLDVDQQEGEGTYQRGQHGAGEANEFYRAAGMVFGLALVHRVINRYAGENDDKTQLLYLLNKVNHGELPITEISRDNMKDFLDIHIGVELKWDKFDSVCQRLDPDRNGFISTPSVILAFEQLTPLVDRLPWQDAQANLLLLLSIATDTLAKAKAPINETFMSLILHNAKSSASFAKYIQKEQERIEGENRGFMVDPISPRSAKQTGDARVAEQQLFVTDVLYELSKEFVYKTEAAPQLDVKSLPKSRKAELKDSQQAYQLHKKDLKYFVQNHQEACIGVSKGLHVYEGFSRKRVMTQLSTLCLGYLNFRRKVVSHLLEHPSGPTEADRADPLATHTTTTAPAMLTASELQGILKKIEKNIATLTGQYTPDEESDPSSPTFSPLRGKRKEPETITLAADHTTLQEYEVMMSELLGVPLPRSAPHHADDFAGSLSGLAYLQAHAETAVYHTIQHFALEESLANASAAPEAQKPLASSQALKDLQKSLYQELWSDTAPESLPDAPLRPLADGEDPTMHSPTKSIRSTLPHDAPPLHVVEEVNDLMHQQRVEQSRHYLEILNEKATRRKKMIRGLMNLWQAAKAAIMDHNKIPVFASAGDIELKRLQAMPVEDIIAQTKSIQQLLIGDMQEKSTTKMAQLSQRVNLLRQGIANQSIPDDDHALVATLREIGALENGLLQANTDAMRLAARIIKQLSPDKKAVPAVPD